MQTAGPPRVGEMCGGLGRRPLAEEVLARLPLADRRVDVATDRSLRSPRAMAAGREIGSRNWDRR